MSEKIQINNYQKAFRFSFIFLFALLVGILVIGVWAWYSSIEESVTGMGSIVPEGKLRRIMAPMNGTVAEVFVEESQEVKKGDLLLELDPEYSEIQKNNFQEQLSYLQNEINALKTASIQGKNSSLNSTQNAWLEATKSTYQSQINGIKMQMEKNEHERKEALERENQLKQLLNSHSGILEKQEKLFKEGGITENEVELQRQKVVECEGNLLGIQERMKSYQAQRKQLEENLKQVDGSYQKEIFTKLSEHEQNVLRFQNEIKKTGVDMKRQNIIAPIDGIVNEQIVRGAGEVATAGQVLLSLVPKDSKLMAEIRVTNHDLSYIKIGQRVAMRIDAFPYNQFGRLEGFVHSISPSTVEDKEGRVFYVIRVSLNKQNMTHKSDNFVRPLRAGMTLTADIITRERNLFSFFLEPIKDNLQKAFKDPSDR